MIFDVKLDGFKRKARLVAGGHMTDAPAVLTFKCGIQGISEDCFDPGSSE